jgi:hypothetical protein
MSDRKEPLRLSRKYETRPNGGISIDGRPVTTLDPDKYHFYVVTGGGVGDRLALVPCPVDSLGLRSVWLLDYLMTDVPKDLSLSDLLDLPPMVEAAFYRPVVDLDKKDWYKVQA